MDPISLGAIAVAALRPYLATMGEKAIEKLGEDVPEGIGKLYHWLRAKLSPDGNESLHDLIAAPDDVDTAKLLELQTDRLVKRNPDLAEELRALLSAELRPHVVQTQTVSGDGAKGAQISGTGNTTSM